MQVAAMPFPRSHSRCLLAIALAAAMPSAIANPPGLSKTTAASGLPRGGSVGFELLESQKLGRLIHVPSTTLDGRAIQLMANIEQPGEAIEAALHPDSTPFLFFVALQAALFAVFVWPARHFTFANTSLQRDAPQAARP